MRRDFKHLVRIGLLVLSGAAFWIGCSQPQPTGLVQARVTASSTAREQVARRNLSEDEAHGGHTLARHVGKTDAELRDRLERERIAAASTYTDLLTAEQTVGTELHREADRVRAWTAREGRRPNLVLDYLGDERHPIGRTMRRGEKASHPCANALVVLKSDGANGYFVLTSYPECR